MWEANRPFAGSMGRRVVLEMLGASGRAGLYRCPERDREGGSGLVLDYFLLGVYDATMVFKQSIQQSIAPKPPIETLGHHGCGAFYFLAGA